MPSRYVEVAKIANEGVKLGEDGAEEACPVNRSAFCATDE